MGLRPIIIKSNGPLGWGMGALVRKHFSAILSNSRGNKSFNLEPYFQNQNERAITFSSQHGIYKTQTLMYTQFVVLSSVKIVRTGDS